MSVASSVLIGIVVGVVLFFVLQQFGVIDRWFEKLER